MELFGREKKKKMIRRLYIKSNNFLYFTKNQRKDLDWTRVIGGKKSNKKLEKCNGNTSKINSIMVMNQRKGVEWIKREPRKQRKIKTLSGLGCTNPPWYYND